MGGLSKREAGLKVMAEMVGPEVAAKYVKDIPEFAPEFITMACENVYGGLWNRPGLSRRERSLLTLAILIQQRALDELRVHVGVAVNNGVTKAELAELIYHATAYCGFPSANSARNVVMEVLGPEP